MANLPGSIKNLNTLLGEQLTEGGGGGGAVEPLVVHSVESDTRATLDKTFGEIKTAFESGRAILVDGANDHTPYIMQMATGMTIAFESSRYSGEITVGTMTFTTGSYDTETEVYDSYPSYSLD